MESITSGVASEDEERVPEEGARLHQLSPQYVSPNLRVGRGGWMPATSAYRRHVTLADITFERSQDCEDLGVRSQQILKALKTKGGLMELSFLPIREQDVSTHQGWKTRTAMLAVDVSSPFARTYIQAMRASLLQQLGARALLDGTLPIRCTFPVLHVTLW